MKKTKKIVMSMILGIIVITFAFCLLSKNISIGTTILLLLLELLFLIFAFVWFSYKERKTEEKRLETEREKEKKEQQMLAQIRLKSMLETYLLIKSNQGDLILEQKIIPEEQYEPFFAPFNKGNQILPAIDKNFRKALEENCVIEATRVREFLMKRDGMCPVHYFNSLERDPVKIALSAHQILDHFISNIGHWAERNWYIWNTKPNAPEVTNGDLKIVDICLIEYADNGKEINPNTKGRFFLYCYGYMSWSILSGNYLDNTKDSKFFVPIRD